MLAMIADNQREVVSFTVRQDTYGNWKVYEQGFEKSIADFKNGETAEQYVLRLAESKVKWKVDVYDASNILVGTYNSEDDGHAETHNFLAKVYLIKISIKSNRYNHKSSANF